MTARSRTRLLLLLALPPVLVGSGIHQGLNTLEARYPALPPETSTSVALRTPRSPSQHCPHVDVFAARVPLRALLADSKTSTDSATADAWARAFMRAKVIRTEGSLIGFLSGDGFQPGDIGDSPAGFASPSEPGSAPRRLLNGAMVVERPPSEHNRHGLLVSWSMPDPPRRFFEGISRWGYPWRLMSGGRHEFSVSEPFEAGDDDHGQGPFVEVRFASAHDYEVLPEEGDLRRQKTIPEWGGRLHRGYARFLLDSTVRELTRGYTLAEKGL